MVVDSFPASVMTSVPGMPLPRSIANRSWSFNDIGPFVSSCSRGRSFSGMSLIFFDLYMNPRYLFTQRIGWRFAPGPDPRGVWVLILVAAFPGFLLLL